MDASRQHTGGAWAALALAALAILAAPHAWSAQRSLELPVAARVLPAARVRVSGPRTVFLAAEDLRAGMLRVAAAATLDVFCNQPGYVLRFDVLDPEVEEVEIEGLPVPVRLQRGSHSVRLVRPAGSNRSVYVLAYRIRFAAGSATGPRLMPVRVSLGDA